MFITAGAGTALGNQAYGALAGEGPLCCRAGVPYFQRLSASTQIKLACRALQPCTDCPDRYARKRTLRNCGHGLAQPFQLHVLS